MTSRTPREMPEDKFKFGMPLLCAEWPSRKYFIIGGGGGTASTGIKNRLLIAKFEDGVMSDQISEYAFGMEFPVRSRIHPKLKDLLIALGESGIKHFRLNLDEVKPTMNEIQDSPVLDAFDGTNEEIRCLLFNDDGTLLIGGSTAGWIQIWSWPEMNPQIKLREEAMYTTLKDLDVSEGVQPDFLVLTTMRGTCELWNFNEGEKLKDLPQLGHRGERFIHCRFLKQTRGFFFYTTSIHKNGGFVFKWRILPSYTIKQMRKKKVASEAVTSFILRSNLMAVGTNEGHIMILTTSRLLPMQLIKNAHMVFITDLAFCEVKDPKESLKLLSISGDASAKVTEIKAKSETVLWIKSVFPYLLFNLVLVLLALYLLQNYESILEAWEMDRPLSTPVTKKEL